MHDHLVDDSGNYLEDRGVLETTVGPQKENIWICDTCGAEAVVEG